jgi:sporulation protein YlmC with PRC-barrel domain
VKQLAIALTVTLFGLGLATGAWGQTRPSSDTGAKKSDTGAKTDDSQRQVWTPDPNAVETGKIIGTKVKTPNGDSVGSIDQLIVDQKDNKITHAIIGKGGVLGVGETKLVFKWSDVKLQRDPDYPDRTDKWVAVVDQAKIDSAPKYEARKEREATPSASPSPTGPKRSSEPATNPPAKKY